MPQPPRARRRPPGDLATIGPKSVKTAKPTPCERLRPAERKTAIVAFKPCRRLPLARQQAAEPSPLPTDRRRAPGALRANSTTRRHPGAAGCNGRGYKTRERLPLPGPGLAADYRTSPPHGRFYATARFAAGPALNDSTAGLGLIPPGAPRAPWGKTRRPGNLPQMLPAGPG